MKVRDLPFSLDFGNACGLTWLQNDQGDAIGAIEGHFNQEGKRCEGMVLFDLPELPEYFRESDRPKWKLESWSPLTISPSVLCNICGHHGFIQNGKWVPA